MDNAFLQIPLVNRTAVVAIVICAFLYIFSKVRKQDMQALRDSNTDLRASIDDKGKEIDLLKTHIIAMEKGNEVLEKRVDDLEKTNRTLQEVMKLALKEYFEEHPKMAMQFNKQMEEK